MKCTLTVITDGSTLIPLPFVKDTVREAVQGYALESLLEGNERKQFIKTGTRTEGLFQTLLDASITESLFTLASKDKYFHLLQNHYIRKNVYHNLKARTFTLTAFSGESFFARIEVDADRTTWSEEWNEKEFPSLSREEERTFCFDGHEIYIDDEQLPLVYSVCVEADFSGNPEWTVTIRYPLNADFIPDEKSF